MKVLVIDDDTETLAMIRDAAGLAGQHVVSIAADSTAGLKLIQQDQPDLLLLDWLMPAPTGVDVLRQLAESTEVARPRYIVMMSGAPDLEMLESLASQFGADEVIRKPSSQQEVQELISRAEAAPAFEPG